MSDDYEYEWPDDGGDNEGWGDDDNQAGSDDPKIQIENNFFEAEGNMKDDPSGAIEQFETCILMEENEGAEINYRFKAMENIVVLTARLGQTDKMKDYQKKILNMMDKVSKNDVSEGINNILDAVAKHLDNKV